MPRHKDALDEDIEQMVRLQAEKTVRLQQVSVAGAEMEDWIAKGHLQFIVERIIAPLRDEFIASIESAKWTAASVPQVANLQGTLVVLKLINHRVQAIVQDGKNAVAELNALKNSTLTEGE